MSKKIVITLHGSSHFKEQRQNFQSRFFREWTTVEEQYGRQRFKQIDIFAQGGQKFDRRFIAGFKSNVLQWERKGRTQIHFIVLSDNDLREAIDRGRADGGFRAADQLRENVQEVVDFFSKIEDGFLIVYTPLLCPKYHRYTNVFEVSSKYSLLTLKNQECLSSLQNTSRLENTNTYLFQAAALRMREGIRSVRCDTAKSQNTTKRFFRTIHSPRGEVRGWEPKNELFDSDGVHLSDQGVTELIDDIVAALKHVPKFKFEVDVQHRLERN